MLDVFSSWFGVFCVVSVRFVLGNDLIEEVSLRFGVETKKIVRIFFAKENELCRRWVFNENSDVMGPLMEILNLLVSSKHHLEDFHDKF